ncbi:hypothetical protein [Nocardia asteroides]|uniref:hypothetical protein n=1 Tax=Nocardia asteroides TaxID=1824 RepID=UPI001E4BEA58|nr:hypothetical protein [Nocardia asteroides]UGT59899.1 hypothetical protein LTT61_22105 [Nocardia asteroides]
MLWVLLAVLIVAVAGLYLLRERGVGRGGSAGDDPELSVGDPELSRGDPELSVSDPGLRAGDPTSPAHERGLLADAPGHRADDPPMPRPGTSDSPAPTPRIGFTPEHAPGPLSPAHHALTQLNQALDVHTPRTEAARQALEAAADRRRVAGFLLARAETEQAELTAREGLYYIRAARVAMRMNPGPELTPLPAQTEAGEIPEARTRTFRGHRIDLSPHPSPTTPHHHPGGRIADRLIPAGWYSEQWWRPALATGAWPPGSDSLFTALFSDAPQPPRPGAGIGLDRKEPAEPGRPPTSAPPAQSQPAEPPSFPVTGPAGDHPANPNSATESKAPPPERDSPPHHNEPHPGGPDPTQRDLPYDDPQYRANGYGITAAHPAPGNNGAEYNGATRNGHRPHGPRGYEDLGGYEGGAYDSGGLDPPY